MDLDNRIWSTLEGGYKIPYNAARPLRRLADADTQEGMQEIFAELWDNLYHQGDTGLASYLAVPQLVAICIDKMSLDRNFIGLCAVIENARIEEHNPKLPEEYEGLYFDSLARFEKYLLANFKNITDRDALRYSLALFATVNGQPNLGKAIMVLD